MLCPPSIQEHPYYPGQNLSASCSGADAGWTAPRSLAFSRALRGVKRMARADPTQYLHPNPPSIPDRESV